MPKSRLKLALLMVSSVLFIAALVFVGLLRSHTPNRALTELATALQENDKAEIERLTTPGGLVSLQKATARYGRKDLGVDLASQIATQPQGHVVNIIVFHLRLENQPVTVFFKLTTQGWKLSSIN